MSTVAGLLNRSKYTAPSIRTGDFGTNAPSTVLRSVVSGTTIQLPFPMNMSSTMNAEWQQQGVSIMQSMFMHNKMNMPTGVFDALKSGAHAVAGAFNNGIADVKSLMARAFDRHSSVNMPGVSFNPRLEMLFEGMSFKSYSLNFMLVPMQASDSDNINQAIRQIQYASAPSLKVQKMFMEYPETWTVRFLDGNQDGNDYLMKINECCITQVDVNYSPNGNAYQTHEKNAPIAVELSLNLTEIIIPTKETIGYGDSKATNTNFYG